ncbi:hypothetical protein LN994_003985 [Salmonella enterica]|nr:hypothetical protein [Salmonella enterica]ECY4645542.1 hypothetical protein [Salmonella enterica subsp. enterica serovar Eastbourne]EDU9493689.1 hypothetical protein [Salmonella enterica subsp. enterica]EDV0774425.1 hypothetical protein [Salmonella enterica subsp. enterica]EIN0011225.1 hypothetical protein [Salmonella enterica]
MTDGKRDDSRMVQSEGLRKYRHGELHFRLKIVRSLLWQGLRVIEGVALIITVWLGMLWLAWYVMAFLHGTE